MDRLESLGTALSNLTMYDIKSMYNQAKNVVLNVSEMEAKVREATNDEPWGASSTLMQEIAQGTFNFQNFNEIMPCIYARFMEKEAKQWRQIYKALQLLEYLVKNGSERVVDDARSHIATIKMLRNFYYIDEKGKDQGLNVRNRSKELVELLSDVDKIRSERRKAKANRNKYTGVGNDALSFSSGGSRYGGFGSESLGSGSGYGGGSSGYGGDYSSRDYNDYSSGGGSGGFRDSSTRRTYEEYDAGDDDVVSARRSNSLRGSTSSPAPRRRGTGGTPASPATPTAPEKPKAPEPVPDLLGLDDDDFSAPVAAPPPAASNKALPTAAPAASLVDDDFDDFQAAPPSAGPAASNLAFVGSAPAPAPPKATSPPLVQQAPLAPQPNANLFNVLSATTKTTSPPPLQANRAPSYMSAGIGSTIIPSVAPNYTSPVMTPSALARQGSIGGGAATSTASAAKPASSGGFDDLWTMSLGSSASKPQQSSTPAKSIQDLQKEKAQAAIWGQGQQARPPMGAGFGSFGGAPAAGASSTSSTAPPSSSGNGLDDLLF